MSVIGRQHFMVKPPYLVAHSSLFELSSLPPPPEKPDHLGTQVVIKGCDRTRCRPVCSSAHHTGRSWCLVNKNLLLVHFYMPIDICESFPLNMYKKDTLILCHVFTALSISGSQKPEDKGAENDNNRQQKKYNHGIREEKENCRYPYY